MQAEPIEYSIGESSLSKLVKYHERESLLLEIDSIIDYMRILGEAVNTMFDEEMEKKASSITLLEKEIENLCVEMNETLSQLLDQKEPAEEELLHAKEIIETIIYCQTCIDRDEKVTNILEKEPVLKYFEEVLADIEDYGPLELDRATENAVEKRLAEYCKQDALVCDVENEGRISSQYSVYEQNQLHMILKEQQIVQDALVIRRNELLSRGSGSIDAELKLAENEYISEYVDVKSIYAYNMSIRWVNEQLQQFDPCVVPYERKFFPEYYLAALRTEATEDFDLDQLLSMEESICQALSESQGQADCDELERFYQIKEMFADISASMGTVFDEVKLEKTEGGQILSSSVEDIYKIVEGLESCNQNIENLNRLSFCVPSASGNGISQRIEQYNAKTETIQRYENHLRQQLSIAKEQMQRLQNEWLETKLQPADFRAQTTEIELRMSDLLSRLREYRNTLHSHESANARIYLLNKYIETQTSPFARRYMVESAAQQCQFCKERIWAFVEIESGYKYCERCAAETLRVGDDSKFEDKFIEARFD